MEGPVYVYELKTDPKCSYSFLGRDVVIVTGLMEARDGGCGIYK